MDQEQKLHAEAVAGERAERELAHVGEGFATLRASYVKAWEETSARDTDARERLWQAVQIVGKVEAHLSQIIATGKLARRQLDDLAGRRKALGIF